MPNEELKNIDEAVAPYFANVYVEIVSVVQALAIYTLITNNLRVPFWASWETAYFLRGLTAFFVIMAVWHRYVTQLAYVAALHWLHTLFPFLFGIVEFQLASQKVLLPSHDKPNLAYFLLLVGLVPLVAAGSYVNTYFQHRRCRTRIRFDENFRASSADFYEFYKRLPIGFALGMLGVFLLLLAGSALANWVYAPWQEKTFPAISALIAALSLTLDNRFWCKRCAPENIRRLYIELYGKPKRRAASVPDQGN